MQKFFLLLLSLLCFSGLSAQKISWQPISREQAMGRSMASDENVPLKNLFKVDFNELNSALLSVAIDSKTGFDMELPLPDGKTGLYTIVSDPVMEADLQARYPNIRTYKVISKETGSLEGRIGTSPDGFYGILDINGQEVLINKVNSGDHSLYSVFRLVDGINAGDMFKPLACGADVSDVLEAIAPVLNKGLETRATEVRMQHFRVGIATTSSFAAEVGLTTVEQVLAKVTQVINQVNLRYNRDHAMHLDLISKTTNLFNMTANDDFFKQQNNGGQLLGPSQEFFQMKLSNSEYDYGQTWTQRCVDVGGVVSGSACNNQSKARGVSCGPGNVSYFLTTVKHEMGHQFSASHTFNSCNGSTQQASQGAYEPGSGSTIMAYPGACGPDNIAGGADDYFHVISILQVRGHHTAYPNCGTFADDINHVPEITLPQYGSDLLTIPKLTAYELIGNATDPDDDKMNFIWEEFDQGNGEPLGTNFASGPLSRSYVPSPTNTTRLVPRLNNLLNDIYDIADRLPEATREMNWKFVARDNNPVAGGVAIADFKFLVDSNAGPFQFTFPDRFADTTFTVGQYVELKWDVANTDKSPVNSKYVDIFYSADGGQNFTDTLALRTPNDGAEYVMIPKKANYGRFKIKGSGSIFLDMSRKALRVVEATEAGFSYDVYPHNALLCPSEPNDFLIKGIVWKGFDKPVKVELVDGWPANTIIGLDKEIMNPGETLNLTIDTKDVTDAGFYTIRLRATAEGQDTLWRYMNVEILPSRLEFEGAVKPLPGTVNESQVPTFAWNAIPGSDTYEFQLSSTPKFEDVLFTYTGEQNAIDPQLVLPPGTVYYWRVRASNRCFDGPWSEYNTFQTILFECNTINALGLPKAISSNVSAPPVDVLFDISNSTGVVADINVKNIDISHSDISKLKISARSPSGKEIVLMSGRCAGISGLYTTFDDVSPLDINCGLIKANKTFKPEEPLSGFNGEPVQGNWSIRITTIRGGSAGKVNNIDFDLCASVSTPPIVKVNNNLFNVNSDHSQVLENKDLLYTCENTGDENIWYILLSEPVHGYFTLYGQEIHKGDRFTQGHLNDWGVQYVPYDPDYEGIDKVDFLVRNDKFAYLAPEQLNIDLSKTHTVSTKPTNKDVSKLIKFYPNPTNGVVNIDLTDIKILEAGRLTLADISGKVVMQRQVPANTDKVSIDLGGMAPGVYFVGIASGNYHAVQKIIKQ